MQVVESPKDSKNPPVIKTVNQNVDVTETDQVGFLVALIQATDKDGDTLWYDIVGKWNLLHFFPRFNIYFSQFQLFKEKQNNSMLQIALSKIN